MMLWISDVNKNLDKLGMRDTEIQVFKIHVHDFVHPPTASAI